MLSLQEVRLANSRDGESTDMREPYFAVGVGVVKGLVDW